ncbi:MAG: hypothetical protein IPK19_01360 [Chloroflexi bacterium]|nr:hypothetical protein [Chloroflexota bacterium]
MVIIEPFKPELIHVSPLNVSRDMPRIGAGAEADKFAPRFNGPSADHPHLTM